MAWDASCPLLPLTHQPETRVPHLGAQSPLSLNRSTAIVGGACADWAGLVPAPTLPTDTRLLHLLRPYHVWTLTLSLVLPLPTLEGPGPAPI